MEGESGTICPDCSGKSIIFDSNSGEYYCASCGLVAGQTFDYSMHWYGEEGTSYSQTTFVKAYKGLGTVDPNDLARHKGMEISEGEKVERNFSNALPALRVIWGLWQVPADLREECSMRYRKIIRKGITHGRNSYAMAIAATSVVCGEYGITRNTEELAKTLDLSHIAVLKCLKAMDNGARPKVLL